MSFDALPLDLLLEVLDFLTLPTWPTNREYRIIRKNIRLVSRTWNSNILVTVIEPSKIGALILNGSEAVIVHELMNLCNKYPIDTLLPELQKSLHVSIRRRHNRVATLLLQKGVNPNPTQKSQTGDQTPLFYAVRLANYELARVLLEYNADPGCQCDIGTAPLHMLASNGALDTAEYLLDKGGDVNIRTSHGATPLSYAIRSCQPQMMKLLLSRGAEFGGLDNAMSLATFNESVDVLRILLDDMGLDIEAQYWDGLTPLQMMARKGYTEAVRFLLDRGANIAAGTNQIDGTALHLAGWSQTSIKSPPFSLVKLLIERGADVRSKDYSGETPLHTAASRGYSSVVQLLLDHGADLEAKDGHDQTALHKAVSGNHVEVARVLLNYGALMGRPDRWNKPTPLQIADRRGYKSVHRLLLEHGGGEPNALW
ncbi:hypothetical protein FQN54_007263 [Arachnomyces sp. PD_36]|nr:hypothetical protein FQN54_007263 [Arachnomyces sp. PD_36]